MGWIFSEISQFVNTLLSKLFKSQLSWLMLNLNYFQTKEWYLKRPQQLLIWGSDQ